MIKVLIEFSTYLFKVSGTACRPAFELIEWQSGSNRSSCKFFMLTEHRLFKLKLLSV